MPSTEEIKGYVADFREFLQEGTFPERKALIHNFVKSIEVTGDEATLTYTIPIPSAGVTSEGASVLYFAQSGPPIIPSGESGALARYGRPPSLHLTALRSCPG